eukprot:15202482-Alexandrium_andersonii.AAC.1
MRRDWSERLSLRLRAQGRAIMQQIQRGGAKWVDDIFGDRFDDNTAGHRQPDTEEVEDEDEESEEEGIDGSPLDGAEEQGATNVVH